MDQPMTDECRRADKIRRFSLAVSLVLMVLCNAILLGGFALSGINLDDLMKTPDFFNAKQDVCLRITWQSMPGANEPVRLCSEWLNLSDPSGTTHYLQPDTKLKKGLDGILAHGFHGSDGIFFQLLRKNRIVRVFRVKKGDFTSCLRRLWNALDGFTKAA